jgi:hypothetical protein
MTSLWKKLKDWNAQEVRKEKEAHANFVKQLQSRKLTLKDSLKASVMAGLKAGLLPTHKEKEIMRQYHQQQIAEKAAKKKANL